MQAVGDLDGLFVNTGREVVAYDPLRRGLAWVSASPLRDADPDGWATVNQYEDQINHDMVLAAACGDDVVVAALQVPEKGNNVDFQGSFRILSKIPQRRLFAFSRSTGKLLWAHYDEIEGQRTRRFRGHDSCGPPLVVGDTVYAPVFDRSGAIAFAIAAYDLHTGQTKWRRLVCSSQQDVNMFGNARAEFASSPLCISDGMLVGASNLGVAFAVEAGTGRLRWVTAYPVTQMPRTMLHGQRDRVVYFANNAPIVADRVVCATPLDSQFVLGLDVDTGRVLWRLPAEAMVAGEEHMVRWLDGVFDDEFLLHGYGAVAVKARPDNMLGERAALRSLVAPYDLRERGDGRLSPRAAVTTDHIWFASASGIRGYDRAGSPAPTTIPIDRYQPGNLLFVDGAIVSVRQRVFDVLFDAAALQDRVEARLRATPDDPAAILRAASLRAALLPKGASPEQLAAVQALYQRGLQAAERRGLAPNHPVRLALQRELFTQSLSRAEAALGNGDAHALDLLLLARDTAPDLGAWVRVQALVLANCGADTARQRRELDLLEERAAAESIAFDGAAPLPVPAFVLWRRAVLPDTDPTAAVAAWQTLIEVYGDTTIDGQRATIRAQQAITEAVAAHGAAVYAKVAARADEALAAAAEDPDALRDVSNRFPNSAAASLARTRLLDRSVRNGDLAMACDVLGQDLRGGQATPGMLRRVAVAAQARGNPGLCRAMLDRLQQFANLASDWPDDQGATYGAVRERLLPELALATAPKRTGLPEREVARIRPRSTRESLRLLPLIEAAEFPRPDAVPLYALGGAELLAFDVDSPDIAKPILFRAPVQFLEHVVLCGTTLIVPDLERVFALDYRTGALRWELPNPQRRLYDGLGVQDGILHVSGQATDRSGGAELAGIEPITGAVVFARPLPSERMQPVPKPVSGQLLAIGNDTSGVAVIERLDPVTGATIRSIPLPTEKVLQRNQHRSDGMLTRLFAQALQADAERVYLPIESSLSGEAPRVSAIGQDGTAAWSWRGGPGRRIEMLALRGDRVVIVESSDEQPGSVTVCLAATGEVVRRTELALDVQVLNWQPGWLLNPAPAALALVDREPGRTGARRFVSVAIDDDRSSFLVPLGNEDGVVERQPLFGDGFVTFGVRPARSGAFRLYSLNLSDRSGALSAGRKSQYLQIGPTFGVSALGAYTVVSGADCLLVLGPPADNR
ncbi:MAG: PQQ-like beta-propeller repeat protein [Planctomycetes bacterium]|nr:PQQ-like beta-propeller repeat protein [Planctomycetota bacterium]